MKPNPVLDKNKSLISKRPSKGGPISRQLVIGVPFLLLRSARTIATPFSPQCPLPMKSGDWLSNKEHRALAVGGKSEKNET